MSSAATPLTQQASAREVGKVATVKENPMWNDPKEAWTTVTRTSRAVTSEKDGVIFDEIYIAKDGGLSEIGVKEDFWSIVRYFSGAISIGFVFYNIYFILKKNKQFIWGSGEMTMQSMINMDGDIQHEWLVGSLIAGFIFQRDLHDFSAKGVSMIEVTMLIALLVEVLIHAGMIAFGKSANGYLRWHGTVRLCWDDIPILSSFSAMRLLHFCNLQVGMRDVFWALFGIDGPWSRKIGVLSWIVFSRILCLIIGMDCFLIRYRQLKEEILEDELDIFNLIQSYMFLNQCIGVVQLSWSLKERLYRFVFAGEDGVMTHREENRLQTWKALVAKRIFDMYPANKAIAIMLAFSDDDIQSLIINDRPWKPSNPAGGGDIQLQ